MRLELVTVLDTRNFKTDIQLFWYITSAYIAGLTEKQVKTSPSFYPAMPALSLFQKHRAHSNNSSFSTNENVDLLFYPPIELQEFNFFVCEQIYFTIRKAAKQRP